MSRSVTRQKQGVIMKPLREPITITAVVDVVGALAAGNLSGSFYLLDTNRGNGSTGIGTEDLKTVVTEGDRLLWSVLPLECEAYVSIAGIAVGADVCEPEKKFYPGSDISYWVATVKEDVELAPYNIEFQVGSAAEPMTTASTSALVGPGGRRSATDRPDEREGTPCP